MHGLDPAESSAEEAFELATREGARYLGIDAGQLALGKLADVVVVDLELPHLKPLHQVVSTLAYSARGADVVTTIVGGEVIYDHGRCIRVDERAIMAEAQRRGKELVVRAELQGLLAPWAGR